MKKIKRFASIFVSLTLTLTAPGFSAYEAAAQLIRVQTHGKTAGSIGVLSAPRIGAIGGFSNSARLGGFDLLNTLPSASHLSPSVQNAVPAAVISAPILETPHATVLTQAGLTVENALPIKPSSGLKQPASALKSLDRTRGIISAPKSEAKTAIAGKSTWDSFWAAAKRRGAEALDLTGFSPRDVFGEGKSGLKPHAVKEVRTAGEVPAASPETKKVKGKSAGRLSMFAGAGMLAYGIPEKLIELWTLYHPYAYGLGVLVGTRVAQKMVTGGIKKLGDKFGWDKNTTAAVNMMVSLGMWTGGASLGLYVAGVPTAVVLGVLSIGGVTIGLAAKGFIRNFLEAVKVLITRPFKMGDRIEIGGKKYTAEDMTLRKFVLKQEDGRFTKIKHLVLAGKPITLQGPYLSKSDLKAEIKTLRKAPISLSGFFKRLFTPGSYNLSSLARPAFWALASWGLLFYGLPALSAAVTWPVLATIMPFAQGGATLWLANRVSNVGTNIVSIVGEKFGLSLQTIVIAKLAVRGLSYGIGGTAALRAFGVTWSALMTGGFAGSFAITWGAAGLMANFIEGIVNLMSKDIIIGKHLKVGSIEGKVIDLNINNVVIGHEDGRYTLIPHSLVKNALLEDLPEHALKKQP